jgi:endonuclease YncB( thermonuclease family)
MGTRGSSWVAWVGLALALAGCDREATAESPLTETTELPATSASASEQATRSKVDTEGLLIGEYRLSAKPVIDGDTIRVEGIEGSIRLLSIDTEEPFHRKADRAAADKNFSAYLKSKRQGSTRPRKTGTPMGEEASEFAKRFFAEADVVRLERDDPKKLRGSYGRVLAYAFVQRNGKWTSYNVECVRAGMSPYFTKYGYSHRFHNQLSRAEAEARSAKRGIWNPDARSYRDYDERKAWWNARADFIRAFEHEARARSDYVDLRQWNALETLEAKIDEDVTVLSTIDRIQRFRTLVRVTLSMRPDKRFPIIFFDPDVYAESGVAAYLREPIVVRGTVSRHQKGSYQTLQIVVNEPSQVRLPNLPAAHGRN